MVEFIIVFAIVVIVMVGWIVYNWLRSDDELPTQALDMKLKPEDPLITTRQLRVDQYRRGPGKED